MLIGTWKSAEEVEECLSIDELNAILAKSRELEYNRQRFTASLNGIKLEEPNDKRKEIEERVRKRKAAESNGHQDPDLSDLEALGIQIIKE